MDDVELDLELRRRALQGDRDAMGRLLQEQASQLRATVQAAGVSSGDADDVVQEAFTRALAHWSDPKSERALAHWLTAIARNVAIDWRRRQARERDRRGEFDPTAEVDPACASGRNGAAILDDAAAVKGLAAEAIAILQLRYGERLSGREISARLGLTYESMKKRLQRARAEALARLRGREP